MIGDVGGTFLHLEDIWMYAFATPDPKNVEGHRGLVIRGLDNCIWVNFQGRRFHNELQSGGATGTPALLCQEPPTVWAIIDSSMVRDLVVSDPYYRKGSEVDFDRVSELLEGSPNIKRASTIEDLAETINVDRKEFQRTLDVYNRYLEEGLAKDPEFGKNLEGLKKIEASPFYAIQFFPLARKNLGGIRTDLTCRVLGPHGDAIPGLYAAGEVAGMAGGHINGVAGLEGTMLGPSIFSGRVAGAWAAHHLGLGKGFP
jgi:predicted oxidoreductase